MVTFVLNAAVDVQSAHACRPDFVGIVERLTQKGVAELFEQRRKSVYDLVKLENVSVQSRYVDADSGTACPDSYEVVFRAQYRDTEVPAKAQGLSSFLVTVLTWPKRETQVTIVLESVQSVQNKTTQKNSAAPVLGFICPKQKLKISKVVGAAEESEFDQLLIETEDGTGVSERRGMLPRGSGLEPYQTRYGMYFTITEAAQLSLPYAPEFLMVGRMIRSKKLYRKGFNALEGKGQPVELNRMYCEALLAGIRKVL